MAGQDIKAALSRCHRRIKVAVHPEHRARCATTQDAPVRTMSGSNRCVAIASAIRCNTTPHATDSGDDAS